MENQLVFISLSFVSVCCFEANAEQKPKPKPNILWLTYEDTSPEYIGCYGNKMAKTPTMDALAADGVLFSKAFSTGTVSSASRFCLITGCHPTKYGTGNHRSEYRVPDFLHGFPEYLRDAGYYTTNNYKTDYNHYDHLQMTKDSWNESSGKAHWRNRKEGQPFFAVFNSPHSHQSRTMTNPWSVYESQVLKYLNPERRLAEDAAFEIPPYFNDSPEMRKNMSRVYNSIALTDQQFENILAELEEDGLRDSTIIFCFSDHGEGLPRAKGSALASGHRVPFIMWIPEMYRDLTPWGSGVISDELVSFDDFGATVLALAGIEVPSYIEGVPFLPKENLKDREKEYVYGSCDAVDNNIELSRTVTDGRYMYTRVFTPYQPFVRWIPYYDHSDIQKQMRKDMANGELNNLQTEIIKPREIEYLYDLKEDRWETVNLANSREHKHIVAKMRKALTKYLIDNRDVHFMTEYTLNKYHLEESMYNLRMDNDFYPFKKILETATLCGKGKRVIEKQIKQLADKNDFVSYWAAIGLFTQRGNLKVYTKQITELLPQLRFSPSLAWASAAVLNLEDNSTAKEYFKRVLASEEDNAALNGLNALLEMDTERAREFIQYLEALKEKGLKRPGSDNLLMLLKQKIDGVEFVYQRYW